jgi:hypothetical protein
MNQLGILLNPSQEFTIPGIRDGEGDADGDGAKDKDELTAGTSPTSPLSFPPGHPDLDTDQDGLKDSWELTYWPSLSTESGSGNPDGDLLTNAQEYILSLNPTVKQTNSIRDDGMSDADADNVLDAWEFEDGTNPLSKPSADLAKNYVVLRGRMQHLSTWGPVSSLVQFNGTVMRATAIGTQES